MENDREDDIFAFNNWIRDALKRGAVAIISHKNGDMDTIGSACALSRILGPKSRACGLHISTIAKTILRSTKSDFTVMDVNHLMWPRELGGVVIVDAASTSQVGFELPDVPKCIIDHHSAGDDFEIKKEDLRIVWETSSTCEIIQCWAEKYAESSLDYETSKLLLSGIITDTGRFRHSNGDSLSSAGRLVMKSGLDYGALIEEMESVELNHSQKVAIAKALSRVETLDVGKWFLSHTKAGTNEGIVARSLISAGADISLVARKVLGETRLTARASKSTTNHGLHLGKLMEKMMDRSGGEGGGHAGAAGWSGAIDIVDATSGFISLLMENQGV
ncbi:MAG: DHH family phosphoesterase [Candidatus Thalassarchaeaceae archaeon]|jgi:nanoRNase/pAp phosphatase (c-di-AMP/oligoRNAs hydrolase)|nr:DHH family phosphoesterase [Candidatus Thalassarchaeaceae archaeon]